MRPKKNTWVVVAFTDGDPEVGFVTKATESGPDGQRTKTSEIFFPDRYDTRTCGVNHSQIIGYAETAADVVTFESLRHRIDRKQVDDLALGIVIASVRKLLRTLPTSMAIVPFKFATFRLKED